MKEGGGKREGERKEGSLKAIFFDFPNCPETFFITYLYAPFFPRDFFVFFWVFL
jgi:hypothetical protein